MVRHIRHGAAVAALTCALSGAAVLAGQRHPYRTAALVCLEVTTVDHLSGAAFRTMREEATRIWLRHGIALTWSQPVPVACAAVIPIVFDVAQLRKAQDGKLTDALAVTVFHGYSRTIYVSVPRAFQLLAQAPQLSNHPSIGEHDARGGMLLGRVVAHELGHVLLGTLSHSQTGLMRPVFGVRDVLAAEERATALMPVETNRLATRFSLVPLDSPIDVARDGR